MTLSIQSLAYDRLKIDRFLILHWKCKWVQQVCGILFQLINFLSCVYHLNTLAVSQPDLGRSYILIFVYIHIYVLYLFLFFDLICVTCILCALLVFILLYQYISWRTRHCESNGWNLFFLCPIRLLWTLLPISQSNSSQTLRLQLLWSPIAAH